MWLRFYIEDKVGVSIIISIPHCHTENALKVYNQEMLFFWGFFIQFNVPFKIISLIETSQSIGGRNGSTPGQPPDTPASRTCLVSHVASAGLEPTPDTAVR